MEKITLRNINLYPRSEILDFVKEEMEEQSSLGLNSFGTPCYRGNNGKKCAVGIFLPEDMYHPDMEGKSCINVLRGLELQNKISLSQETLDLLWILQYEHDKCMTLDRFLERIEELKKEMLDTEENTTAKQ